MLKLPFRSACAAWFVALTLTGCSAADDATLAQESEAAASTGATFAPAPEALARTRATLDARLRAFDAHVAKRPGARPFYRLHPAGERVHGTVLVFHGFSNRPAQMELLGQYLYDNGFNVYAPTLAGQDTDPPETSWPRVQIKPQYKNALVTKLGDRLVGRLSRIPDPMNPSGSPSAPNTEAEAMQSATDALEEDGDDVDGGDFRLREYFTAATTETEDNAEARRLFAKYFVSSHKRFHDDAQARLDEVRPLGGAFYTVGLSVGGAVALSLAEANPGVIRRVVVHAPFLAVANPLPRTAVGLLGPLDIMKMNWGYDFPLAAITAAARFGGVVRTPSARAKMAGVPTFMVLTATDRAADVPIDEEFYKGIGGRTDNRGGAHRFYKYPKEAQVPHPMTDPREKQSGTGFSNRYWKPLYRETLRFLVEGEVNTAAFDNNRLEPGSVWNLPVP